MARSSAIQTLQRLESRPFRVGDAEALGVPGYELRRLRDDGLVVELARGVYQNADAAPSATIDLVTVSTRAPEATICLNSALAFWELSDEIPPTVHIAVARGTHRPHISYPPTTVHVFAAETFALGRSKETGDEGGKLCIYSRERTIVDAMRLARVVGRDQALQALRRYVESPGAQPAKLVSMADQLRAAQPVRHALEVLLG